MRHLIVAIIAMFGLALPTLAQIASPISIEVHGGDLVLPEHGWGSAGHPDVYEFSFEAVVALEEGVVHLADIEFVTRDGTLHLNGAVRVARDGVWYPVDFPAEDRSGDVAALSPQFKLMVFIPREVDAAHVTAITISAHEPCFLPESWNNPSQTTIATPCW